MFAASICSMGHLFSISNPTCPASRPKSYVVGGWPKLKQDRSAAHRIEASDAASRQSRHRNAGCNWCPDLPATPSALLESFDDQAALSLPFGHTQPNSL